LDVCGAEKKGARGFLEKLICEHDINAHHFIWQDLEQRFVLDFSLWALCRSVKPLWKLDIPLPLIEECVPLSMSFQQRTAGLIESSCSV
jgi:hypothetical protein